MSARFQGLAWCFTFVLLDAVQSVYFGGILQRLDSFLVGFLVFGLTTILVLGWLGLRQPAELRHALGSPGALAGMNLTFAGGWAAYLLAIQLIEPAVAFTLFTGLVPLATMAAARLGAPHAESARNPAELAGNLLLAAGLLALCLVTLAGFSGFVRGGTGTALAGLALAAISGCLITAMLLFCRHLDSRGVTPMTQFGLRFPVYLVLSLAGFVLGLDSKGPAATGDLATAVALGLLLMAFPIYAVQKAVSQVSALTIGAFAAVSPLFVFLFQLIEGRVDYAPPTLFGLLVCFAGASLAVTGASRAPAAERRV